MKKLAIVGLLMCLALPVSSFALGSGCVTNTNTGDTASVCFTVSGNTITINSVTINGVNVTSAGINFDEIGIVGSTFASGGLDSGFTDAGAGTEDGFGSFTDTAHSAPPDGFVGGSETFTVTNMSLVTGIVFHFGGININGVNCSMWVGGPTISSSTSGGAAICGSGTTTPPPVPEPSSLGLLGAGLAGAFGIFRRRLTR